MDNNTKLAIGGCVVAVLLAAAVIAFQISSSDNSKPEVKLGPPVQMQAPASAGAAPGMASGPGGMPPVSTVALPGNKGKNRR